MVMSLNLSSVNVSGLLVTIERRAIVPFKFYLLPCLYFDSLLVVSSTGRRLKKKKYMEQKLLVVIHCALSTVFCWPIFIPDSTVSYNFLSFASKHDTLDLWWPSLSLFLIYSTSTFLGAFLPTFTKLLS